MAAASNGRAGTASNAMDLEPMIFSIPNDEIRDGERKTSATTKAEL